MSGQTIDEINDILRRTNRIYLTYNLAIGTGVWGLFTYFNLSRVKKVAFGLPLTVFVSGVVTWVHVLKVYDHNSVVFLKVGLDKQFPSISKK